MTIADMILSLRTTDEGLIEWALKVQAGDTVDLQIQPQLNVLNLRAMATPKRNKLI